MKRTAFLVSVLLISIALISSLAFMASELIKNDDHFELYKSIIAVFYRVIILCALLYIIRKFNFDKITRLNFKNNYNDYRVVIMVLIDVLCVVCFLLLNGMNAISLLFVLKMIVVGLMEELLFRGIILPVFLQKTKSVIVSLLLSSLLFGLMHYLNLIENPNTRIINGLVLYAFSIGVLFGGVFLFTQNIYSCILLHIVINIISHIAPQKQTSMEDAGNYSTILFSIIMCSSFIGVGLLLSKTANKKQLLEKVEVISI